MELEEIVKRCQSGDRDAQEILYKRYSQRMLSVCSRRVSDHQAAQDIMHDGFILIFASIGQLRQYDKLECWMSRIMANLSLQYISETRSEKCVSVSDLSDNQTPFENENSSDPLPIETILELIERLPEGYRRVFKLSVLEGLSHNEIGTILHIAPHSSSSQFYRAKEQLKKLILQYRRSLLLLLFLLPSGYISYQKKSMLIQTIEEMQWFAKSDKASLEVCNDRPDELKNRSKQISKKKLPNLVDTTNCTSETITEDTISVFKKRTVPKIEPQDRYIGKNEFIRRKTNRSDWALSFGYNGSRGSESEQPQHRTLPKNTDISSSIPAQTDNWEDYFKYLNESYPMMEDTKEAEALLRIARRNSGKIREKSRHHMPFTIGLQVQKTINEQWSIGTGLSYTCLDSEYITGENSFIYEKQKLHYFSVPLKMDYNLKRIGKLSLYTSASVTLHIPLSGSLKTDYIVEGELYYIKSESLRLPAQWSIGWGLGLDYKVSDNISLYAEPKIDYYFDDGGSIRSIRKAQPFVLSLPIGIRFSY